MELSGSNTDPPESDEGLADKEKLEIVLSVPVQGEVGGRGMSRDFRLPSPVSSVRIFSNRNRFVYSAIRYPGRRT